MKIAQVIYQLNALAKRLNKETEARDIEALKFAAAELERQHTDTAAAAATTKKSLGSDGRRGNRDLGAYGRVIEKVGVW